MNSCHLVYDSQIQTVNKMAVAALWLTPTALHFYSGAVDLPNCLLRSDSVAKKKKPREPEVVGFLGLGFDNEDGHQR